MKSRLAILTSVAVALLGTTGVAQQLLYPDTAYVNGTVLTMDSANRTAEAVAVRGDTIVAVGSNAEIRQLVGPTTRVVDLGGAVLTPGFYAPHDSFPRAGLFGVHYIDLHSPPLGTLTEIKDVVEAVKKRAQETPKGEWVVGWGYDDTLLKDSRHPTRYDLDKASADHPIWVQHISNHLGAANSKALELAHITKDTPQPHGGVIRKDPRTGEPDGVLEEVNALVTRLIPPFTEEQKLASFKWAVQEYASRGVTTAVVTHGDPESVIDLQTALAQGILSIRVVKMTSKSAPGTPSPSEAAGLLTGFGNDWIRLGGVKIASDGSLQGYTGYLSVPYYTPFKGDKSYRGYPHYTRDELAAMVMELHRAGHRIAIHANGDAGIDDAISAFREAQRAFPRPDARHRIEHCQTVREEQLDAIKELGITPSFFIGHVYYWGDRHRDLFLGPDRAARLNPLKSALDRGIRFTVHDDTPVTPVNPLQDVWVAATRLTTSGKVLGPEQRISPLEALRAVTIEAAWQNFEEKTKGSIEPGKLADFVVLAENPLTVDPVKIKDVQILETILGGKTVYTRQRNATP